MKKPMPKGELAISLVVHRKNALIENVKPAEDAKIKQTIFRCCCAPGLERLMGQILTYGIVELANQRGCLVQSA